MAKYIIVRSNRLNNFGNRLDTPYSKVINMFSDKNKKQIIEKEIRLAYHLSIPVNLFNPQLINVDADTIIVFDGHVRNEFLIWLQKHNPYRRIILWLWNTVDEISKNFDLNDVPKGIEIWSYSKYDCQNYGLKYNTTFFWNHPNTKDIEITQDVFYVGKDKGRYKRVLDIKKICEKEGLRFDMVIVPNHKYSLPKKYYSKALPYSEVENRIARSRAILDVKVNQTAGPSLRALEASFYGKKLITDDKGVKDFKFYLRENIFILGEEPIEKLPLFLHTANRTITMTDIEYYNPENWLSRFNTCKE